MIEKVPASTKCYKSVFGTSKTFFECFQDVPITLCVSTGSALNDHYTKISEISVSTQQQLCTCFKSKKAKGSERRGMGSIFYMLCPGYSMFLTTTAESISYL